MIVGLTGLAGSGKDTLASFLVPPQARIAFAEPLKHFVGEVFGATHRQLYGPSEAREEPLLGFTRPDGSPLTVRFALQTLGTEWGRNCDPEVWAKAGILKAQSLGLSFIVITDVRFVNEAKLIRAVGGEVWRIRRRHKGHIDVEPHASEREIWSSEMTALVTHEVDNRGTVEDLRRLADLQNVRLRYE